MQTSNKTKNYAVIVADEKKRLSELKQKQKNYPVEPTNFLNVVGKRCDYDLCVRYDVNKLNDPEKFVTEIYEVYEHREDKNVVLVKHKVENFSYEKLEDRKDTLYFFDKPKYEYIKLKKISPENNRIEKSRFGHKRLNKEYDFLNEEFSVKRDYYFVVDAKFQNN